MTHKPDNTLRAPQMIDPIVDQVVDALIPHLESPYNKPGWDKLEASRLVLRAYVAQLLRVVINESDYETETQENRIKPEHLSLLQKTGVRFYEEFRLVDAHYLAKSIGDYFTRITSADVVDDEEAQMRELCRELDVDDVQEWVYSFACDKAKEEAISVFHSITSIPDEVFVRLKKIFMRSITKDDFAHVFEILVREWMLIYMNGIYHPHARTKVFLNLGDISAVKINAGFSMPPVLECAITFDTDEGQFVHKIPFSLKEIPVEKVSKEQLDEVDN